MSFDRLLINLCVTTLSLLTVVACTPSTTTETASATPQPAAAATPSQVQSGGEDVVVEATAMPDAAPTIGSPSQSEPGAGTGDAEPPTDPAAQSERPQSETMSVYANSTYHFSVSQPADFVVRMQSAEMLAQRDPKPVASFRFMSPQAAASDLGELEAAELEISVHAAGTETSLNDWLISTHVLQANGATAAKPLRVGNVPGMEVCASTMIAPGCSYYVMGNGWVYQLTPASLEGETMVTTFLLAPS